jgi:hypothetical protein
MLKRGPLGNAFKRSKSHDANRSEPRWYVKSFVVVIEEISPGVVDNVACREPRLEAIMLPRWNWNIATMSRIAPIPLYISF